MLVSVVDIGTNSTRLLVAAVDDSGRLTELERRSTVTRLGEGVDATGALAPAATRRVFDVLDGYRRLIDAHDAGEHTVAVLTSAVRDAADGDEFTAAVRDRYGLDARVIPGEEEARLTFRGATSERPGDGDGTAAAPLVVIDIGGGSTELVAGAGGEVSFFVSTQVGVVRFGERHLTTDPPDPAGLAALREQARAVFAEAVPGDVRDAVRQAVATGGTATSVAGIDQDLEPFDPARVHGYRVARPALEAMLERLASMTNADRRGVRGLHPDRAPTIVAGVAILLEALATFGVDHVEASEHDILHGAALELWSRGRSRR